MPPLAPARPLPRALLQLPNALTAGRLAAAAALVGCAGLGARSAFLTILAAALATDAGDGALARALGATSVRGARLDSRADLALVLTVPAGVAVLWPALVLRERWWVATLVLAYLAPLALGFAKYRRMTSYHTIAAKAAAVAVALGAGVLLMGGPGGPFHLGVGLLVASAVEEVALTLLLPAWRADVGSLWHVRRAAAAARPRSR